MTREALRDGAARHQANEWDSCVWCQKTFPCDDSLTYAALLQAEEPAPTLDVDTQTAELLEALDRRNVQSAGDLEMYDRRGLDVERLARALSATGIPYRDAPEMHMRHACPRHRPRVRRPVRDPGG